MTKQTINTNSPDDLINVGNSANDRRGDSLRAAFIKLNDAADKIDANFTELYARAAADATDRLVNGDATVLLGTDGNLTFTNGTAIGSFDSPNGIELKAFSANDYVQLNYNEDQFTWLTTDGVYVSTNWLAGDGKQKLWLFDKAGTITVPGPMIAPLTLTFDAAHYVATELKPTLTLSGTPWELIGEYEYAQDGQSMLALNNIWPTLDNPGYESGDQFTFDASVHGIAGYTLTITLTDVVQAGPAGWTANVSANTPPVYPATVNSNGAIKLTSNDNSWIFSTDGKIHLPSGGDIVNSNGTSVLGGNANTGDFAFVNNVMYNIGGAIIENSDLTHGPTSALILPVNSSDPNPAQLNNFYGAVEINTGYQNANPWSFGNDGTLSVPGAISRGNGKLELNNSDVYLTATTNDSTALYMTTTGAQLYAAGSVNIVSNIGSANGLNENPTSNNVFWSYLPNDPGMDRVAVGWSASVDGVGMYTVSAVEVNSPFIYITLDDNALALNYRQHVTFSATAMGWEFDDAGTLVFPDNALRIQNSTIGRRLAGGGNNFIGSRLIFTDNTSTLESYADPDGPNNMEYGRVSTGIMSASLSAYQEDIAGQTGSELNISPSGMQITQGDGILTSMLSFNGDGLQISTDLQFGNSVRYSGSNNTPIVGGATTTIFTAQSWMTSLKLVIAIEGRLDGDITGTDHTQTCEATVAATYNTSAEPVMSVYGSVYTSPTPLATFSVRRGPGNIILIDAINSQASSTLYVRTSVIQFVSNFD